MPQVQEETKVHQKVLDSETTQGQCCISSYNAVLRGKMLTIGWKTNYFSNFILI